MPLTNFFTYQLISNDDNCILAKVRINPEHPVFEGHFPGNPVTPGVTQIEIIREIISETLHLNLVLSEAKDIKYINPILPENMSTVQLEASYKIDNQHVMLNCKLFENEIIFTKIRGVFSEE